MSLRFRRRINIIPGVHLNISRSGISSSVGVRGASVTLGKRGTYLNTGIPGTGVSWRGRVSAPDAALPAQSAIELPSSEATSAPHYTHHLHWWKVLFFLGTIVLVGASKSETVIALFWYAWFAYWFFLLARRVFRKRSEQPLSK